MVARYTLQKTTLPTTLPVPPVGFMYLILDDNSQLRAVTNVVGVATLVEVVDSPLIGAQPISEKAQVNGYASLDGAGKVPLAELPAVGGIAHQGSWNASTNTPTLVSSTGTEGFFYVVSVAGTTALDGISDWAVNDWCIFIGGVWRKLDGNDDLTAHLNSLTPHIGMLIDETTGEESFGFTRQITVGTPGAGKESVFGEGDSYTTDMSVMVSELDETGPFVDRSAEASSRAGSDFDAFSVLTVGGSVFFGGPRVFPGLKLDVTVAGVLLLTGHLELAYWNGSAWVSFIVMITEAEAPYTQSNVQALTSTGPHHVRFQNFDTSLWQTKVVNGVSKYWIRVLNQTGVMTTSPRLELVKLHTNRFEVNKDGFTEKFGTAIKQGELASVSLATATSLNALAPGDFELNVTTTIDLLPTLNQFKNNALDGFGGLFIVEEGVDTSKPITFTLEYSVVASAAGDVEIEFLYASVPAGSVLDGTIAEVLQTNIQTIATLEVGLLRRVTFEAFFPVLNPGDSIAWAFYRDGAGGNGDDTYANHIAVATVRATAFFWKDTK